MKLLGLIVLVLGLNLLGQEYDIKNLQAKKPNTDFVLQMAEKQLRSSDPEQYQTLKSLQAEIEQRQSQLSDKYRMLIYFTSKSVPSSHFIKIVRESARANDAIIVNPILRGMGQDLYPMLDGYKSTLAELSSRDQGLIRKVGRKIRINPKLFQDLKIDKVPAIAFAECQKEIPSTKYCDFKIVAQGEVSLARIALAYGSGDSASELYESIWR